MKNARIALSVLLALILAVSSLTLCSCSRQEVPKIDLVLILGIRGNSIPFSLGVLDDIVHEAAYSYGSVTVIPVDADPSVAASIEYEAPGVNIDETRHIYEAQVNAKKTKAALNQVMADSEEADLLTAINLGANRLRLSTADVKKLLIVDSGLSTSGLLDFSASQLIYDSPDHIIEQLKEKRSLPDLRGVDVTVLGLGQTALPQAPLTTEYEEMLHDIWSGILSAAEPGSLVMDPMPLPTRTINVTFPTVSTMEVIAEGFEYFLEVPQEEEILTVEAPSPEPASEEEPAAMSGLLLTKSPEPEPEKEPIPTAVPTPEPEPVKESVQVKVPVQEKKSTAPVLRFDESRISFIKNTAEVTDPDVAIRELKSVADYLAKTSGGIIVAGSTATVGDPGICRDLSRQRAATVKAIPTDELGVDADRISTIGLGRDASWLRANDLNSDGSLNELAQRNRCVFICLANSTAAEKLVAEKHQ